MALIGRLAPAPGGSVALPHTHQLSTESTETHRKDSGPDRDLLLPLGGVVTGTLHLCGWSWLCGG